MNLLLDGGNIFETKVYQELKQIYGDDFVIVLDNQSMQRYRNEPRLDGWIGQKNQQVKQLMRRGVPLIGQAPLINPQNRTYGVADILIRSDYLPIVFEHFKPDPEQSTPAPLLGSHAYHYRVIDCKWTTMTLCVDGSTIRNEGLFPAYKGQLAVYTAALWSLQGYVPRYAYVMAKAWKIGKSNILPEEEHLYRGYSAFDRLGVIDYHDKDACYIGRTKQAIKWVQRVISEGRDWIYGANKPTVPEMYPNMKKSINPVYDKIKSKLAQRYGDPTMIWYVDTNHRQTLHTNGITDLRDPRCDLQTLGIKPTGERARIIRQIIETNQHGHNDLIRPARILTNTNQWQIASNTDMYVDFETINYNLFVDPSDVTLDSSYFDSDVTFMIGMGMTHDPRVDSHQLIESIGIDLSRTNYQIIHNQSTQWEFVCLYLVRFDLEGEREMFRVFFDYVIARCQRMGASISRLFHWTDAELRFLNKAICRMRGRSDSLVARFEQCAVWVDMCRVFQTEPIVIRGAYCFKLKHIGNAMHANQMIRTQWTDHAMSNGLCAMLEAIRLYRTNEPMSTANQVYKQIIDYNEIDCKVIWEIVGYLRANHSSV